jgi:hypothetical protein
MWIERCLAYKTYVDPDEHPVGRPVGKFPIDGFRDLTINSTGFEGIDLLHLSKLVKLVGATYDEILQPRISVLICNSTKANLEKQRYARSWGIPVVSDAFLWACLQSGRLESFDAYGLPGFQLGKDLRESPKRTEQNGGCEKSLRRVKRPRKRGRETNSLKASTTSRRCLQRLWLRLSNGRIQSRYKIGLVQTFMKTSRYYQLKVVKIAGEGHGRTGKILKTNSVPVWLNLMPILTRTPFYHYEKSPPILLRGPPRRRKRRIRSRYFVPSTAMAAC